MPNTALIQSMSAAHEIIWLNPGRQPYHAAMQSATLTVADIDAAEARLLRFAPLIAHYFPETQDAHGIIESPLTEIPAMADLLRSKGAALPGRLFLKRDSDLPVAGSVKARGGIYEVLKHSEELALAAGLISGPDDEYLKLATPEARAFFAAHKMQVGSTGNLGMSIGIMSAALGYEAIVHMSADAKQWKKDKLRSHGVTVIEYEGDYGEAVANGRRQSDADPQSYFVDDENSTDLFFGYAVAGRRLKAQLDAAGIVVDAAHPLFAYLPCGVGGAPGGIAFGLRTVFGDAAHCFFIEPTQAPCMTLGLVTGKQNAICVQDIGLTGQTQADGLAVGRPSGFIGRTIAPHLSGCLTVDDSRLNPYLQDLYRTEQLFIEPSSCAAFIGPEKLLASEAGQQYLQENKINPANILHLAWATGGRLVPQEIRAELLNS